MAVKTSLKSVPDTNVVLASEMSSGPSSPNREFFDRWKTGEFLILYSEDTLLEYIEKLQEKSIPAEAIKDLLSSLLEIGVPVAIEFFHLPTYPATTSPFFCALLTATPLTSSLMTDIFATWAIISHSGYAAPSVFSRISDKP